MLESFYKLIVLALIVLWLIPSVSDAGYERKKLAGWTVLMDRRVLKDKKLLQKLESTLKRLNEIFPKKALAILHRVPIQAEWDKQEVQQLGNRGTRRTTGYYKADPIKIIKTKKGTKHQVTGPGKVYLLSKNDFGNTILLVHELSHAAHLLSAGFENKRIKDAYRRVVEKKLYKPKSYMMSNHKEYFAEMSVVYLSRLHYFPHDRATLKKHDPISYKLMEEFWGKR